MKLDNIELRSESVQEVLSHPPNWMIRWGITVIFLALLSILAVSWFIKYPDFIPAQVLITTQNPPEKIEARINGKIEKLYIKNQDNVHSNQILATILNSANNDDVIKLSSIIDTLQIDYDNFQFPFHKFGRHSFGDVESEYINFERAFIQYSLHKKLQPYAPETLADKQALNEISSRLISIQNQKRLEQAKVELEKKDLDRNQLLYDQGVISAQEMEKKRFQYLQAKQNLQNIDLSISQLQESRNTVHKSLSGTSITKQQTETEQLKALLQAYDQLRKSVSQWDQTYLLRSSINGTVSFQNFWGENQFVKPGEIIFTILPEEEDLLGRLVVPAQNTGKIEANQKVIIKLDNYPYQQFGVVEGKVKNISLSPDAEGNYFVEVLLPKGLKTSHNQHLIFNKEMSGTAEIVTENLRLIERFFYQFRKVFQYQ
ncbi:MAG: HlyD family efflux transporter periplasmic adaptor subunit [Flavobacteriaceae bacterium]|nr:HlyD family efflux transporter periplasmic adaptor subunit [Flavobacteriaceae bacterium]